jgi:glycosyltransferase involved in cell wall biosynthesis
MKITIVTITLNAEKFLSRTIESVLSQDYPSLEYLIVDGGSTDNTIEIIKSYASIDGRIKWLTEPDRGISDAMNKGITLASGDVISHLHSDDYFPSTDVLSSVAEVFYKNPLVLWVTGGVYFVDSESRVLRELKVRNYSYRKLVRGNCILHPATFVRRIGYDKVGLFDVSLKYTMDYDLWLRLGAISAPLTILKPLACFRIHRESISVCQIGNVINEELSIRKRLMCGNLVRYSLHYLLYLLKKPINRFLIRDIYRHYN